MCVPCHPTFSKMGKRHTNYACKSSKSKQSKMSFLCMSPWLSSALGISILSHLYLQGTGAAKGTILKQWAVRSDTGGPHKHLNLKRTSLGFGTLSFQTKNRTANIAQRSSSPKCCDSSDWHTGAAHGATAKCRLLTNPSQWLHQISETSQGCECSLYPLLVNQTHSLFLGETFLLLVLC